MNKYQREIKPGVFVDVYDVLKAWGVTNPALQHLIKKALQPGDRGHKDLETDLKDIVASAQRALELESTPVKPAADEHVDLGVGIIIRSRTESDLLLKQAIDRYLRKNDHQENKVTTGFSPGGYVANPKIEPAGVVHPGYSSTVLPRYRLRLEDGTCVFMAWHWFNGPTFYRDKAERREIEDWWENPQIGAAFEWFLNRGKKA